jgi:hypothetical protein
MVILVKIENDIEIKKLKSILDKIKLFDKYIKNIKSNKYNVLFLKKEKLWNPFSIANASYNFIENGKVYEKHRGIKFEIFIMNKDEYKLISFLILFYWITFI